MSISAPMMSGWLIQHRSNALASGEGQHSELAWVGRVRVLCFAQPVLFGSCVCIWCAPCWGLPAWFMLTGAKANERWVLLEILAATEAMNEV